MGSIRASVDFPQFIQNTVGFIRRLLAWFVQRSWARSARPLILLNLRRIPSGSSAECSRRLSSDLEFDPHSLRFYPIHTKCRWLRLAEWSRPLRAVLRLDQHTVYSAQPTQTAVGFVWHGARGRLGVRELAPALSDGAQSAVGGSNSTQKRCG